MARRMNDVELDALIATPIAEVLGGAFEVAWPHGIDQSRALQTIGVNEILCHGGSEGHNEMLLPSAEFVGINPAVPVWRYQIE